MAPSTPTTPTPATRPNTPRPTPAPDLTGHLPAVLDLVEAAALLGLGRTTAYRLVHDQQWPTPVLRLGRLIKIRPNHSSSCSPARPAGPADGHLEACSREPKRARRTTAQQRPTHRSAVRTARQIPTQPLRESLADAPRNVEKP
jgi:hypothetical protein